MKRKYYYNFLLPITNILFLNILNKLINNLIDIQSCQNRWNTTKHLMTSTQLPEILNDTTMSTDVNHCKFLLFTLIIICLYY